MRKILLAIFIILTGFAAKAQYNEVSNKSLGDRAFKNKDYYEAAYYYKKAATGLNLIQDKEMPYVSPVKNKLAGKTVNHAEIEYMLAESYRLYENYLEAEGWYYKTLNEDVQAKYPLARLWYGVCLRANQHFDEAIKQLKQFSGTNKGDGEYQAIAKKEIANCTFAIDQYQYPALMESVKMKSFWNTDGSNYAILKRDGNYFFTSSRLIPDDKKHLNRIYTVKGDAGKPEIIAFKKDEHKEDLEYGTPSLDPSGKRMYLTRWYKDGDKTIHGIYKSEFQNGEWSTPVKLNSNINAEGYSSIQPFITADGKRMFFVSNKPGGQGGDDIWVSDLDANGDCVSSTNLGKTINTTADEQSPNFDINTKRLVYSSKGFIGLGGFDFFESTDMIDHWSEPKNMGYPMNSAKDDLYFYPDKDNPKKFYISSDRESDCCLELFEVYDKRHELNGLVVDCETHKPLDSAKVSFVDSLSKQVIKEQLVGRNGKYSFSVTTKRPYNLVLERKGYFTKIVSVPATGKMIKDTLVNEDICLQPFVVNKPIVIQNILYDFNKSTLRPESETVLDGIIKILHDNPKIKIELASHTDSIGSDAYNIKLSQERAQSCVDYIISKGIEENRILAKGYGKSKPIAPNSFPDGRDNPDGRQLNRRTEFTVLKVD